MRRIEAPAEYTVTAEQWERGWVLTIHAADGREVGVTQAHRLTEAEGMARDYLRLTEYAAHKVMPDVVVTIVADLGEELARNARDAKAMRENATDLAARAAATWREVVRVLVQDRGLSYREAAVYLGVSQARIAQLHNGKNPSPHTRSA